MPDPLDGVVLGNSSALLQKFLDKSGVTAYGRVDECTKSHPDRDPASNVVASKRGSICRC